MLFPLLSYLLLNSSTPEIDRSVLLKDSDACMKMLTSDQMAGRLTLSKGMQMAANYLASEAKKAGLKTSIFEYATVMNDKLGKGARLELEFAGKKVQLKPNSEFTFLHNSPTRTELSASLVWAGWGDSAAYSYTNIRNKVVLLLRGMPEGAPKMSNSAKAKLAKERGAVGVIFVGPQVGGALEIPATSTSQGLERGSEIVGAGISSKFAEQLTGELFESLRSNRGVQSKVLKARVSLRCELEPNRGLGKDVIGVIPGTDPYLSTQYVVLGAHFDHLGWGETSSRSELEQIHYGADDNASGSSCIMAVAKYLVKHPLRRTVLVQWYSGEEEGLLGSDAWCKANPTILERTHCMVNLDMVGRLRKEELIVFGSESSKEMPALLSSVNEAGVKVVPNPSQPPNSDHASFSKRKVVAIAPFTGFHDEYHTHLDRYDTINHEGIAQVAGWVIQFMQKADAVDLQMSARPAPQNTSGGQDNSKQRRVRTGFIPDMGGEPGKGMLIQGVGKGSPAEKAGVKAGDRLVQFGDVKIVDIEDLQSALVKAEPGKPTKIIVIRDGKQVELTIVPELAGG